MRMIVLALFALMAGCDSDGAGSDAQMPELAALPIVATPPYKLVGSGLIAIVLATDIAQTLVATGPYDYVTRLNAAGPG
jgi:hypothetical protein